LLPHLTLCTTEERYREACAAIKVKHPERWLGATAAASTHTFVQEGDQTVTCVVCILVDKKRSFSILAGYLSNEATHVAQELFESIGERKPSNELYAYVVQNVTESLVGEYMRQAK
jgi:hypothetical protein